MAKVIDSPILFMTTSPRSPEKMIPEIELLLKEFDGLSWNRLTQASFMKKLSKEQYFNGNGKNNPSFSARDRINRAPKSLGFVVLKPKISITPAGKALLASRRKEEVFLRQLLKFQMPSPFHKPSPLAADFWVKPYLELIRLIRQLGTLKFDELQIFGMQMTNWHKFDEIVRKIEVFRSRKLENKKNYREFKRDYINEELRALFAERIAEGEIKTRESKEVSLEKFLATQSSNMRDYADACFRYLRATGLVSVSHVGKSLSIVRERTDDVDFILETIDRDPVFVDDEAKYISYLGDAAKPRLFTDDREALLARLRKEYPQTKIVDGLSTENLKDLLADCVDKQKEKAINEQVRSIKDYKLYDDIQNTFRQIKSNELFDAPLMLEWNTWRAMTMLDGGEIKANLNFDDYGKPLSTAQGNMPDIVCDYGDFLLSVEVTMASGQRQYETEGEPVSRHLGKMKRNSGKTCYCLFVAPRINEACVAHFFSLYQANISYYGGKSVIVPLPLETFQKMVEESYKVDYVPDSARVKNIFEYSESLAASGCNEKQWYDGVLRKAENWLG